MLGCGSFTSCFMICSSRFLNRLSCSTFLMATTSRVSSSVAWNTTPKDPCPMMRSAEYEMVCSSPLPVVVVVVDVGGAPAPVPLPPSPAAPFGPAAALSLELVLDEAEDILVSAPPASCPPCQLTVCLLYG